MGKSSYFSNKCVSGQPISLIDNSIIKSSVKKIDFIRYVKRFKTKDYLISTLFCSFTKCNSLRQVFGEIFGLSVKTDSFKLSQIPKRSTLYDANKNRKVKLFEDI
jgi:hypothetical protein